jgi:hypothetical protein
VNITSDKALKIHCFIEGFYYVNIGNMRQAQDASGPRYASGITDKILVELHNATSPYGIIHEYDSVCLFVNGTADISNLGSNIIGPYYVVINQRNSIETWSANPVNFSSSSPIICDFTNSVSQAFGNNEKLMGSIYAILSGDAIHDRIIDGSDLAVADKDSSTLHDGYNQPDFNGDVIVDRTDMALIDNNSSNIVRVQKPE